MVSVTVPTISTGAVIVLLAIATAFKNPVSGDVFSTTHILAIVQNLYNQLASLRQQRVTQVEQPETLENIIITSDRIYKINAIAFIKSTSASASSMLSQQV